MKSDSIINYLSPPFLKVLRPLLLAVMFTASAPILLTGPSALARGNQSNPGTLQGAVSTVGPDGQPLNLPAVALQLKGLPSGSPVLSIFSNDQGEYRFVDLQPGDYVLEANLQGFKNFSKNVVLHPGETVVEDIRLELETLHEEVNVEADSEGLNVQQAAPAAELQQNTLQTVPLINERFHDALPLVPGVVRGPDGLLNVKGSRASQSGLVVNSANVTDPVTGEYAISLPIDVIQTLQVLTNPYAPEYGLFTGGVTSVETRHGTEKWKVQFQNFFPRARRRGGRSAGLESATPRLTFSGPLKKDKLQLLQSFEYRFVRTEVEVDTLPPLQRDKVLESFDSFTQLDWDINSTNHLTTSFSLFPQKLGFVTLDTFNPEEVTANFKQRGFYWGLNEKMVLGNGSLLESFFSIKSFDANVFPSSGSAPMNFAPNVNSGNFFNRQDRESRRYEALETYSFIPRKWAGSHLVKVAAGFSYTTFNGRNESNTVRILRANGTRSQQIDFVGNTRLHRNKGEWLAYIQDKWSINDRFTLEYGVRYDRDGIAEENNFAPRLGFAFLPVKDGRSVIRGGVGLFYDKISLNVGTFEQLQERVLTRFAADGTQVTGVLQRQRLALNQGKFRTPHSLNWNIEFDREWLKNFFVRVGYQQREGRRDYLIDPTEAAGSIIPLRLSNSGNSRYKEFQVTARYKLRQNDHIVASYVRSAATGDLNDFNSFFGNFENPIIRPNERTRLPWDAPNRFLFWGEITLKYGIIVAPVLEIRDGFPLSNIDEDRNFVGSRNRAGRFSNFASLDTQILKRVKIPLHGKKYMARVGVKIFNLTNHFNPRDFQGNLASSSFGTFTNSVDRSFRGKFEINF